MGFAEAFFSRRDCKNCELTFSTEPRGAVVFLSAMLLPLCSRMVFAVHRLQSIERNVRIDLRGRDISVAQEGLDGPQIGAVLHHMGGTPGAQHVWAGLPRPFGGRSAHELPNPLS